MSYPNMLLNTTEDRRAIIALNKRPRGTSQIIAVRTGIYFGTQKGDTAAATRACATTGVSG